MTFFIIGLVVAVITAIIGWLGVQRTGNYENKWGAMMIWAVPLYIVVGGFLALIL